MKKVQNDKNVISSSFITLFNSFYVKIIRVCCPTFYFMTFLFLSRLLDVSNL